MTAPGFQGLQHLGHRIKLVREFGNLRPYLREKIGSEDWVQGS